MHGQRNIKRNKNCTKMCKNHKTKQDRQCACNVTMRPVITTIVAVKKQCVTYSECVFVDLDILHVVPMCHNFICVLSGSTIFYSIISKTA